MRGRRLFPLLAVACLCLCGGLGGEALAKPDKEAKLKIIRPSESKYKKVKIYKTDADQKKRFKGMKRAEAPRLDQPLPIENATVEAQALELRRLDTTRRVDLEKEKPTALRDAAVVTPAGEEAKRDSPKSLEAPQVEPKVHRPSSSSSATSEAVPEPEQG